MNANNQYITASRTDKTWVVALTIVCIGILGYGVFYSTNTVSNWAFLAGENLVYAVLLWGIFHAVFLRKHGSKMSATAFAVLYAALFTGGMIAASKQERQAISAVSSIQEQFGSFSDAVLAPGKPTRIERTPVVVHTAGEAGEVERFVKETIDRTVALRNDYLLELEAVGWESILDPQRLKKDTTLSESRMMIERAKVIIDKYEKKNANLIYESRTRINALNMSESSKTDMLAGFDKSVAKSALRNNELWSLEKQAALEFGKIVGLLTNRERWLVEGEQLIFYSDDDVARFNSHLETIQSFVQQQEQIQKIASAEVGNGLEVLKNSIGK